jgi:hypothetical protein
MKSRLTDYDRFCGLKFAVAAIALLSMCISVQAQDYEELPLYQVNGKPVQAWTSLDGPGVRDKTVAVTQMLAGTDPLDTAAFDQYFNEIVFPLFTEWKDIKQAGRSVSPLVEGLSGVNNERMRERFKKDFAQKATSATAHEHLNELTLKKMDQIASGNFHPVVRATAAMMIAELNETDSTSGGPPWKKALPMLLSYANTDKPVDAVRVPAWRGIVRQAQAGIDSGSRPQVIKAIVQTLGQRNDVAGHGQDAQDWVCRRAIDTLVALKDPDTKGELSKALLDIINDAGTSLTIRATAAGALANIKFVPPAGFDASALAKTLGKLAVEDYKNELDRDAKHQRMVPDRLRQQLGEIRQGLVGADGNGGVGAMSTSSDVKQYVNSLISPIDNLIAACNTDLLPPPTPTTAGYNGTAVVVPIDRQAKIAEAITNAGANLENAVTRSDATAPAGPAGTPPATKPPDKGQQNNDAFGVN